MEKNSKIKKALEKIFGYCFRQESEKSIFVPVLDYNVGSKDIAKVVKGALEKIAGVTVDRMYYSSVKNFDFDDGLFVEYTMKDEITFGDLVVGEKIYQLYGGKVFSRTITSIEKLNDSGTLLKILTNSVQPLEVLAECTECDGWIASIELLTSNLEDYAECLERMKVVS